MPKHKQRLCKRDAETIARITRPASIAATLVHQYVHSEEFRAMLQELIREELMRMEYQSKC